ncbi:hypothetical protein Hanom_Chr16g01419491 [Helianthus anomalus]
MLFTIIFLRIKTLVFNMPLFTIVPAPHILSSFRQVFPTTPTASVILLHLLTLNIPEEYPPLEFLWRMSSPKTLSRIRSNFKIPVSAVSVTIIR